MSLRLKPQDITPLISSPFMTVHGARVVYPLAEVLKTPGFFDNVRSNLRAGDTVKLCRFEHGDWTKARVVEFCEVMVAQSSPMPVGVRFAQSGPLVAVPPEGKAAAAAKAGKAGKESEAGADAA